MHISVVVPFHNVEEYIADCIEALLAQRYPEHLYEIIMVDNNSTDRSPEIASRYPRITLLSESRVGAYAARNRGVAKSEAAIVAFTDSDCVARADWLERIAGAMTDPEVHLVQGGRRFGMESSALSVLSDYEAEKSAYIFSSDVREIYFGYTNNMAVRRSAFERVGGFMELARGADTIFVQRVIAEYSCRAVQYRPDVVIDHLEVKTAATWFHKMNTYGRSSRRYSTIVPTRPLNAGERLRIWRGTIRNRRYSVMRSTFLLVLLAVGVVCFEVGRLSPVPHR